jgi:hypothetical protein
MRGRYLLAHKGLSMALSNPVAVYNAANNVEVHLICTLLEENGIEAHATLDESLAGYWAFGILPEIHKPQVWVDRSNIGAVKPLLEKYELDRQQRRLEEYDLAASGEVVTVACEDCGKSTAFPYAKLGSVQDCAYCGAYVDVEIDGMPAPDRDSEP